MSYFISIGVLNEQHTWNTTIKPTPEEWYREFHRCYTPEFEQGKVYLKESKGRGKVCSICKTNGRYKLNVLGKSFLRYHILWMMKYGVFPTKEIDHIDRNKQNETISILRECTRKENLHNTTTKQGSSK